MAFASGQCCIRDARYWHRDTGRAEPPFVFQQPRTRSGWWWASTIVGTVTLRAQAALRRESIPFNGRIWQAGKKNKKNSGMNSMCLCLSLIMIQFIMPRRTRRILPALAVCGASQFTRSLFPVYGTGNFDPKSPADPKPRVLGYRFKLPPPNPNASRARRRVYFGTY